MFVFTVGDLIGIVYIVIVVLILLGIGLGDYLKRNRRRHPRK